MITAKDELAHNIDLLGEEEILRRLDSHAALVEACRAALDCLGPTQVEVAAIVRAALAAAGETKGT